MPRYPFNMIPTTSTLNWGLMGQSDMQRFLPRQGAKNASARNTGIGTLQKFLPVCIDNQTFLRFECLPATFRVFRGLNSVEHECTGKQGRCIIKGNKPPGSHTFRLLSVAKNWNLFPRKNLVDKQVQAHLLKLVFNHIFSRNRCMNLGHKGCVWTL